MARKKINVIREEMLQVANNVAEEKNIDQDSVFMAMEQALEKAARVKYGTEIDIRVSIDRSTGDIKLNSYLEVVDQISEEFQSRQISISIQAIIIRHCALTIGLFYLFYCFLIELSISTFNSFILSI